MIDGLLFAFWLVSLGFGTYVGDASGHFHAALGAAAMCGLALSLPPMDASRPRITLGAVVATAISLHAIKFVDSPVVAVAAIAIFAAWTLLREIGRKVEYAGLGVCSPLEEQLAQSEQMMAQKKSALAEQEISFRLFADRCEAVRGFGSSLRFKEAWQEIERGSQRLLGSPLALFLPQICEGMPSGLFPEGHPDVASVDAGPWRAARDGYRVEKDIEPECPAPRGDAGLRRAYWIPLALGGGNRAVIAFTITSVVPPDAVEIFSMQLGLLLEKIRLYHEVELQSRTDLLTGLPHQAGFRAFLAEEFDRAKRTGRPLTLLMADIDHFKSVNDTYGHLVGDQVLTQIAHRIKDTVRISDIPTRYGGEEFAILLIATPADGAAEIAERIRAGIEANAMVVKNETGEEILNRTVSIGIATYHGAGHSGPSGGETAAELLENADRALYRAKKEGRNRVIAH